MASLPSVVVPGSPYPVTQRGNRRQRTFFKDKDDAAQEMSSMLRRPQEFAILLHLNTEQELGSRLAVAWVRRQAQGLLFARPRLGVESSRPRSQVAFQP